MVRRHHLAVLVDRREDHEVGADAARTDLGDFQRPETPAERDLQLVGDVLGTSSVTSWARNTTRVLLERRAHRLVGGVVSRNVASVTPRNSAPKPGPRGTMSIGEPPSPGLFAATFLQIGPPDKAVPPRSFFLRMRSGPYVIWEVGLRGGLSKNYMKNARGAQKDGEVE